MTNKLILIDAMGGDFAPENPIKGAILALENPDFKANIGLVGDKSVIESKLSQLGFAGSDRIKVIHASQTIEMDDSPTKALKEKQDSSMVVGLSLVKQKKADAFISAGNTGAQVAASLMILGRISGISRPAIGTFFPTMKGKTLVLDVGATADCKPLQLFQFAIMGSIYSSIDLNVEQPTVAIISVGEEDSKGNEATIKANQMLRESDVNFIGNVEGKGVLMGFSDVIVCDGFIGNILLKMYESIGDVIKEILIKSGMSVENVKKELVRFDYEAYGGAPLLGIEGVSIISHGKSSAKALMNAALKAEQMVDNGLVEKTKHCLDKYLQQTADQEG